MKRNIFRKFKKINFHIQPKFFIALGCLVILSFIIAYLSGVVYSSRLFIVKEIKSNVQLEEHLQNMIKRTSLIKLNTNKLHLYIMKGHPEYKTVAITKEFPSTLSIDIKKRIPVAQIKNHKFYLIDKDSVVITDGSATAVLGLIPIEIADYRGPLARGTRIQDARLHLAMGTLIELRKKKFFSKFPVRLLNVTTPANFYVILANTNIILGSADVSYKLSVLEGLIKSQLKGDLNQVAYIDLRYKKAYIGFRR